MASVMVNGVAMLAARLLAPAFSFAINVGVARLFGSEALGVYVHLMALLVVFQTFAGAGISLLLAREIAARPGDARVALRRARSFGLGTGLLATAAFVAWTSATLPEARAEAATWLALAVLPSAWMSAHEGFFLARRRHHLVTLVVLAENAAKLGLALAVFLAGGGLVGLCAGIAVARVGAFGLGTALVSRAGYAGAWRASAQGLRRFGRTLTPFAAIFSLSMLYYRVDVLLVEHLLGEGPTGLFGGALALHTVLLLLPDSAMAAIYPRLAATYAASYDAYAAATGTTARLLAAGTVPLALAMIVLAEPLLALVYGGEFREAAPVLRLLAASLPLHAANGALGHALQAGHRQGAALKVVALVVVLHVGLSLVLIPRLGIEGAALALLLSAGALSVGTVAVFHREARTGALARRGLAIGVALGTPVAAALLVPDAWRGAAAAAGLLWLLPAGRGLGALRRADLERAVRAFRPVAWRGAG